MEFNAFKTKKKEKEDNVNVNSKKEKVFLVTLLEVFKIILVLGIKHTNETKKKLCDDEIKCSKKACTTKW